MADPGKRAFIHRLARSKRQPEAAERRFEPLAVPTVTGESIAAELRRAREDLGRDLVRVADDLKIRRVYLQAIEDGRFDDLPGATYAVGFVRAYAEYLGLDSVAVVGRFKEEVDGLNERLQLVFPTPAPESKIPSGAVLLISTLLIVLAYGGWYYLSSQDAGLGGEVLDLPAALEPLVSGAEPVDDTGDATRSIILAPEPPADAGGDPPGPRTAQEPDAAAAPAAAPAAVSSASGAAGADSGEESGADGAAAESAEGAEAPAGQGDAAPADPPANPPVDSSENTSEEFQSVPAADRTLAEVLVESPDPAAGAAADPLGAAASGIIPAAPNPEALLPGDENRQPRIYGVENETARIVLRARLDSWVQVHAADESLILTRVLQPGDSYRVPNLAGLTLVTGNAGGLEVEVDGSTVPPLGPVGAIRRGIALDPDRLVKGTAVAQ